MFTSRHIRLLLCCLWISNLWQQEAIAQYNINEAKIWALADSMGLSFHTNPPSAITTNIRTFPHEGVASISNSRGELLFYTNGEKVWDRSHNLMPNGDIKPSFVVPPFEAACGHVQLALIVPFVNDTNKYYLFTSTRWSFFWTEPANSYFSIIDMDLNGGLGDIVPGSTTLLEYGYNNFGVYTTSSKMTAVPGDKCNIWVIRSCVTYEGSYYRAYEINDVGLDTVPVITRSTLPMATWGNFAVSNDRKKIASTNWAGDPLSVGSPYDTAGLIIADFDPDKGTISNAVYLDSMKAEAGTRVGLYLNIVFSPDDSKLYALKGKSIYQFDLNAANPAASGLLIDSLVSSDNFFDIKLGPDGKMYIKRARSIDVIHEPNKKGNDCRFESNVYTFDTNPRLYATSGFPNVVVVPVLKDTQYSFTSMQVCPSDLHDIELRTKEWDSSYSYSWSTGDTQNTIIVNEPGFYRVQYDNSCDKFADSFYIEKVDFSAYITADGFSLGVSGGPFVSYQWYKEGVPISGETNATYTITSNGTYSVQVTDEKGCTHMTDSYTVDNYSNIEGVYNSENAIRLYPNPADQVVFVESFVEVYASVTDIAGRVMKQPGYSKVIDLQGLHSGIYFIKLNDKEGRLVKVEKIIKQ